MVQQWNNWIKRDYCWAM